ncbi:RNA-binding protein [Clostridium cylindrosporum]|uniref:Putative RNA-binding protein YlmH n=1 Tax=Clostridium cylindrosporum DSM 605 TaxID=1121307 RepID=A0A0J8DAV8_CLOCY|nr:YlmH/Sll1252 family protein [Clostridium cylindrosporum]KMT21433.1 putative RNA-binding protein YlmH [Clostridium cylindrosporum DSM 605]
MDDKFIKNIEKKFSIEKEKVGQFLGKIRIAKKNWDVIYTDFLTLNEQEFLKILAFEEDVYISFYIEDDFERKMALISPIECLEDFPIKALKITGNFKFEKVDHRDYLGSILGLGIKREKVGDINVYEDGAEILVHRDVAQYILFNLIKVKHTGVKVLEIDISSIRKKSQNLKELNVNVSSLRFDAVLSGIFNISRTKSSSLIKSGDAKINNIISTDSSTLVKSGQVITLRKYGKIKVGDVIATTKKERLVLSVYKYI